MKRVARFSGLLICLFFANTAMAATATATFTVTTTVTNTCSISATNLAFPTFDPFSATNTDGASTITVTCTNLAPYNVGLDAGTGTGATVAVRKMTRIAGGTDTINYSLYQDAPRATVWGNTIGTNTETGTGNGAAQILNVYGRIPGPQPTVPAASYLDTITATITY